MLEKSSKSQHWISRTLLNEQKGGDPLVLKRTRQNKICEMNWRIAVKRQRENLKWDVRYDTNSDPLELH